MDFTDTVDGMGGWSFTVVVWSVFCQGEAGEKQKMFIHTNHGTEQRTEQLREIYVRYGLFCVVMMNG